MAALTPAVVRTFLAKLVVDVWELVWYLTMFSIWGHGDYPPALEPSWLAHVKEATFG